MAELMETIQTEQKEMQDTEPKQKKAKKEKKPQKEKKPLDKAAKKKRRRIILGCIAGVLVILIIINKVAGANSPSVAVPTVAASTGEIEQVINTSGTVQTKETKSYFSNVGAKIGKVFVEAGDAVKKGDLLISYDTDSLNQELELAKLQAQSTEGGYQNSVQSNNEKLGDLSEATVNLEVLDQQIADTEAYIKNLEAKIEKKKSDLAYQGTLLQISLLDWQDHPDSEEYMNLQKQVQLNSYEQQNNKEIKGWQDELSVYNDMLADYKEYRSEMKSQKSSAEAGKLTAGAKEQLEADNQTKEIEQQTSLENLEAAENGITAEFDGVVTQIDATEGQVAANGSQILKLESTEDVAVRITVTKYDLDKIKIGQSAKVTIGSKEYQGEVSKIDKMAEKNNSGATVVGTEIKITNPDSDVILGVEAKVVISTAREENVIIVPVTAVNVDVDGEFVYTVENNVLLKKPVQTGISSDTYVQITEGLSEGEQVVTEVSSGLTEGMMVLAMPEE